MTPLYHQFLGPWSIYQPIERRHAEVRPQWDPKHPASTRQRHYALRGKCDRRERDQANLDAKVRWKYFFLESGELSHRQCFVTDFGHHEALQRYWSTTVLAGAFPGYRAIKDTNLVQLGAEKGSVGHDMVRCEVSNGIENGRHE